MKVKILKTTLIGLAMVLGVGVISFGAYAEEGDEAEADSFKTGLTMKPVQRLLELSSSSNYDGVINLENVADTDLRVEVFPAPYTYNYSEENDEYTPGFITENRFTQISRWTKVKDSNGNFVDRAAFTIPPHQALDVEYKITTPEGIPAGGQYEVIFAQTDTGSVNASGIRTEASAGMIIYGRSTEGELITTSEMYNMILDRGAGDADESLRGKVYAKAKVKNTGNIDFFAKGILKVDPIIGFTGYETPSEKQDVSIIPESERGLSDVWEDTPSFGIYKATWTITAGDHEEKLERIFFLFSPISIILIIIVLTIIITFVIIGVRKRKARKARLAV